jgi:NADPH:quinone reductase-like Zn-dependent oxidoreductase
MRAISYSSYGGVERLTPGEHPRPTPGPAQILVKVAASSVNPVDWKVASGKFKLIMPVKFPCIPGFDMAGEIVELGPGVTGFRIGQRVHARLAQTGASAEFAVAGVEVTAPMPATMSMAEAAALPLAGMTALQGLRNQAGLPMSGATQRVLVVGASGGVGHLAVQIAKASGAKVVGVCSGRNVKPVQELGADEVLDYTQPEPYQGQAPFDIVLDCVSDNPGAFLPLLGPRGCYATTLPGPKVFLRSVLNPLLGRKAKPVMLKSNAADLRLLDELYEAGKLKVLIDSRHPLASLGEAWTRSMSGRAVGKIVVLI